jgi:hypothetical protein
VVTDRAWTLAVVVDELMPAVFHETERYANNRNGADHGRLKARLRPMRSLTRDQTSRVNVRGHALMPAGVRHGPVGLNATVPVALSPRRCAPRDPTRGRG